MRSSTAALRLHVESVLHGRIVAPFRVRETLPPAVATTGISSLDARIGGLPRGCLTEIYGPACSGKTSVLHAALAERTAAGEVCALVDAQDAFDPCGAQSAGVVLERLLWVRCRSLESAIRCMDLLLHGGGFGIVVFDVGDVAARQVRKIQLNVWFRMRRAVEDTNTALLVLSQVSNAKTCASLVLRLEREASHWSLQKKDAGTRVSHTPGCLVDGSQYSAEMIRSLLRRESSVFADASRCSGNVPSGQSASFSTTLERYNALEEQHETPVEEISGSNKKQRGRVLSISQADSNAERIQSPD